jgi:hypothetical protein
MGPVVLRRGDAALRQNQPRRHRALLQEAPPEPGDQHAWLNRNKPMIATMMTMMTMTMTMTPMTMMAAGVIETEAMRVRQAEDTVPQQRQRRL